jgi:hypothetical protein
MISLLLTTDEASIPLQKHEGLRRFVSASTPEDIHIF